ncbi:MAG TPA: SRPBCC family protein [Bdellovibrio sp.]|nr:SRPBCC family protein [Bdellovibrio sp.]
MPGTVTLHRVIAAPPERVFKAFVTAGALAKWIPPKGFFATIHSMESRVGGSYKMSFTNLTMGNSHSSGGKYVELVEGKKLKYTTRFDDPNLPGEMYNTITLSASIAGTDIKIVQEGIPDGIPVDMCYLGWQDSLDQLIALVTPEIKD